MNLNDAVELVRDHISEGHRATDMQTWNNDRVENAHRMCDAIEMVIVDYLAKHPVGNKREVITEPVYVKVREGEIVETTPVDIEEIVMFDWNKEGMLVGVEILNVKEK